MLTLQAAQNKSTTPHRGKIGFALAGGGPAGGIYELGVLRAMDEAFEGINFNDLDVYVGVSSGSLIAAALANHITVGQMCRIFIENTSIQHPMKPGQFLQPAYREYLTRAGKIPTALIKAAAEIIRNPLKMTLSETVSHFFSLVPSGIFDNEKMHDFLEDILSVRGRSNDFRELDRKLVIVAVDIDTGETVRFGTNDLEHVPISRSVQASAALPGLYPPVEIDGRYYVDGALRRTLNASVALEEGIDLMIGINPLVPYAVDEQSENRKRKSLVDRGLPLVLSQTVRALIQSRMQIGIAKYASGYPETDLLLLEPDRGDDTIFFTNVFSFSDRHDLVEHAYQATRNDLLANYDRLSAVLNRHGINIDKTVLEENRTLSGGLTEKGYENALTHRLNKTLDTIDSIISGDNR